MGFPTVCWKLSSSDHVILVSIENGRKPGLLDEGVNTVAWAARRHRNLDASRCCVDRDLDDAIDRRRELAEQLCGIMHAHHGDELVDERARGIGAKLRSMETSDQLREWLSSSLIKLPLAQFETDSCDRFVQRREEGGH
tara:strand:+ start:860 stop:1276 length:417 start_codon:yes stop_codon:yes gene_type:complete